MGWAWSRTFYAEWHGILFNFEAKRDRDYFLAHLNDAQRISAREAYKYTSEAIRVPYSASSASNEHRKEAVKSWYANKRGTV